MDRATLLAVLLEYQIRLGESDRLFGARLGIGGPGWSWIRRGHRRMGAETIMAAFRAFPDLYQDTTERSKAKTDD